MTFPHNVRGEIETIQQLLRGKSIGRLGDGELAHLDCPTGKSRGGGGRQACFPGLTSEMWKAIIHPAPNFIVGVPTMDAKGPKYKYQDREDGRWRGWHTHEDRFGSLLSRHVQYYSAFITRPDSAPWIDTREFAEQFQRVWEGKRVCVVGKQTTKILPLAQLAAKEVEHLECPERDAYAHVNTLEAEVWRVRAPVVLVSAGPTATVLAHRIAKRGLQAIDMGSAGAFLCRLLDA